MLIYKKATPEGTKIIISKKKSLNIENNSRINARNN